MPQYFVDNLINLSPGYQTNIVIKPTTFDRKTEDLGRCASRVPLWLFPTKSNYLVFNCIYECLQFIVYEKCNCVVVPTEYFRRMHAMKYNKPLDQVLTCSPLVSSDCTKNALMNAVKQNLFGMCSQCKTPCFETKYEYRMTSMKLNSNFAKLMNITTKNESISKNYLLVRFSFESLTTLFITETRSITVTDLVMYWGGLVGLYLGMSFTSFYEIFHYILAHHLSNLKGMYKQLKLYVIRKKTRNLVLLKIFFWFLF